MQEYDIWVFCDRYESLNTAQGQSPALPLSCSWVAGFLLYIHSALHLCFQQTSNKAKLMNLLQHANVKKSGFADLIFCMQLASTSRSQHTD